VKHSLPATFVIRWVRRRVRSRRRASPAGRRAFALHKESARAIAHARLEHFVRFYAALTPPHTFTYHRVSIRNQRTRWGSCSRKGNLNFSYKIALLPLHLVDYLIVHELCHLEQFNHSPAFWSLVELAIPDYRTCRKELADFR